MRSPFRVLCAGALLLVLAGCGGDGSTLGPDGTPRVDDDGAPADSTATAATLAQLSADIFTPKCATAGCHGATFAAQNMPLTADRIAAAVIGVPSEQRLELKRVDPGNPDGSYLLQKVRGTGAGAQMPLGRAPLSAAEIQRISDWIAAGAPAE